VLVVVAGVAAAHPVAASADVSRSAATSKALSALGSERGSKPVVVFRQPGAVPAGTAIAQAGASSATGAIGARARERKLRRAGVTVTTAPVVTRTGAEPAWLFYEDQAPYQAYQHRGRVALVGQRTGRVTVTRTLGWPPLIAGRLPVFLQGYAAYRAPRHRVFVRAHRLRGSAPNARAGADTSGGLLTAPVRSVAATLRTVSRGGATPAAPAAPRATDPSAVAASKLAADQLAAEQSCAIRVSDTLGDFYDAGPVDRTRAELGTIFERLATLNSGFHTDRYRYLEGTTPAGFVARKVRAEGCRDVLLYLGGGGYRAGAAAVNVGTRGRPDGRVEQQVVTAKDVRSILRAHRGVTFKVMIDAPYSGAFLPVLTEEPNLVFFAASSGAAESSFTALAGVTDAQGRPVANVYNARGHLEFTNRQLEGLKCFLSRPDEVAAAARSKAQGRTRSFLGWMLARSFSLCAEGSLADLIEGAPNPVVEIDGEQPSAPTPPPAPAPAPTPGPTNRAPVAAGDALSTPEDTAVALTLAGTDPDGDPLTYAVVRGPAQGTLSGDGATRVYTPDRDAPGTDSFSFTVSDGRATSAPATVSVAVGAVNDAPTVATGPGSTGFVETGPAVVVDADATVADVDDDRLAGATLAIGPGFAAGDDDLEFADTGDIVGAYDATTGVLRLTGSASAADYQAAIRSVRFATTGPNPSAAPREIAIRATDGELEGAPAVRTVTIRTVNDAPVLAGGGTTASSTEDDTTGVDIAPTVTAADGDSPTLASATVRVSGGLVTAEDRLAYAAADGITGSYDDATGVLTLTGRATVARYQAALRRVRYRNANTGDPDVGTRTIALRVDDGATSDAQSNEVTTSVDVTAVNDAPTVTPGGADAAFAEGGTPVAVAPSLAVADADDTQLAGATVRIATGNVPSEDVLTLPATPGLSASYTPSTGVLVISGTASVADYQAALRSVAYRNANADDPASARRTVTFSVTDGDLDGDPAGVGVGVSAVNDTPVLGGGNNAVTFLEDDPTGVTVAPNLTVSDVDSATLASASIAITTNRVGAEDRLEYAAADGITGTYDATTGTLQLTGAASPAAYQDALRRVRYRNANGEDPSAARRVVQFTVNDGASSSNVSTAVVSNVDVTPTDDAPTIAPGAGAPSFAEGGAAVQIVPGAAVGDADDTELEGATVSIGSGFVTGEDVLRFANQSGITGTYGAASGVLTLTGTATVAEYQVAIRSVQFENTNGDDPTGGPRTISFVVTDGSLPSAAVTKDVAVVPVGDAPVVTTSAGVTPFVEDGGPVAVDPSATLGDIDSATISGATVRLAGAPLQTPEGTLALPGGGSILGVYDARAGTLALTGTASVADYQAALRQVTYDNTSDTPDTTLRTVTFTATDGAALASADAIKRVSVFSANDRPVVTAGGGSPTFTEGAAPVVVDPGATVTDPDETTLQSATVCICANYAAGQDELSYVADASSITGGFNAATGTLTLTGTATAAEYQAALRRVEYRNSSTQPSTASRRLDMAANDGTATSLAASTTLKIDPINTAPALGGGGNTVAYGEDDPATVVNGAITITDPDDTDIEGATVSITNGLDATEDRLTFTDASGITGSYDAATGVLTLSGQATLAQYEAALRVVRYENTDDAAPSTAPRTVAVVVNDGNDDSDPAETAITVAQQSDAPVVTSGTGNVRTFVEDGPAVTVDDALAVTDADSLQLSGATATISAGRQTGDALAFTPTGDITGSYAAGTGVLELSGPGTPAEYQVALRSVTFSSPSQAPTGSRTVAFRATDDVATTSAAATHGVAVQGENDAPALGDPGALSVVENDAATPISPSLTLTDVDSADLAGARVQITTGRVAAEDQLSFTPGGGISGSYDASTGTLTLSGTASVATYRTALQSVAYRNTSDAPSEARRTVVYTGTDSATPGLDGTATATVDVQAVNDAPTTVTDSDTAVGNTRLARGVAVPGGEAGRTSSGPSVLANDADVDGPSTIAVDPAASSATSARGGAVTWNADGTFSYVPPTGYTGTDTLTYRATDGTAAANGAVDVTVSGRVWYVRNTATGGGTGRSTDPFDALAEADAAATSGSDRIYVLRGDGTTAGLTGGVSLLDGQQLVGAGQDLVVFGDQLFDGTAAQRPSVAGTVAVEDGNAVSGLAIDGGGAPAIQGAGDAGGTLSDLRLTAGSGGAGVSLANTMGTWNVSDTTVVATGSGEGIVLATAGTVNFSSTGTISVATAGGRGLTVSGTQTSGAIDSTTVSGSPTTGVALTSTTGSLTLDDLNLTTTGTGLALDNANGVVVNATGDGDVTSAGTAVDLSSDAGTPSTQPQVALDQVTSTGGPRGIRVSNIGNGTFSAAGGAVSGHNDAEVAITGGSGDLSYGGTVGNGSGLSARVADRTGGTVTVSGSISDSSDAGGGITSAGGTGGVTFFSGATKTLDTGASNAVDVASSGAHAVRFTGGGLDIDTTSGTGFSATSAGTVGAAGPGNSILSTSGPALVVNGPDVTTDDLTFDSVRSTGATSGILLRDTGTIGGLNVTGVPAANPAVGSGGAVLNATGPGVELTNTAKARLAAFDVTSAQDDGIRATNVAGFALTGGSRIQNNGNAADDRGLDLSEVSGTASITGATVTGNGGANLAVINDAVTLSNLTVDGGVYNTAGGSAGTDVEAGAGILIRNNGAGGTTATIRNAGFDLNRQDQVLVTTDTTNTAVQNVTIQNNTLRSDGAATTRTSLGGGIRVLPLGAGQTTATVTGNDIQGANRSSILVLAPSTALSAGLTDGTTPAGTAVIRTTVTGNTVGADNVDHSGSYTGSAVALTGEGSTTLTALVQGNTLRSFAESGVAAIQRAGTATLNATVIGNTVEQPDPDGLNAMRFYYGTAAGEVTTSCLDVGGTDAARKNRIAGGGIGGTDLRVSMRGGVENQVDFPGYLGGATDTAALGSFLAGRNDGNGTPGVTATQGTTGQVFGQGGAGCPQP
jgi:hypothetical protein